MTPSERIKAVREMIHPESNIMKQMSGHDCYRERVRDT
jgi:hypothetical protein